MELPWHTQVISESSAGFDITPEDLVPNTSLVCHSLSKSRAQGYKGVHDTFFLPP